MMGQGCSAILGESLLCYPPVASLLSSQLYVQRRDGGWRSTFLHVCLGEQNQRTVETSGELLLHCVPLLHTESVLKGMPASSADAKKKKGFAAFSSARLHPPVCLAGCFPGATLVFLTLLGKLTPFISTVCFVFICYRRCLAVPPKQHCREGGRCI